MKSRNFRARRREVDVGTRRVCHNAAREGRGGPPRANDPRAREVRAWHAFLSRPRITLAPAARTPPAPDPSSPPPPPSSARHVHRRRRPPGRFAQPRGRRLLRRAVGGRPRPQGIRGAPRPTPRRLRASQHPEARQQAPPLHPLAQVRPPTPPRGTRVARPPGRPSRGGRPRRRAPRVQTTGQGPDHDLPIVFADREGVPPGPIPPTRRQVLPRRRRCRPAPTPGATSPPPPPPSPNTKPPSRTPRGRSRSAANGE